MSDVLIHNLIVSLKVAVGAFEDSPFLEIPPTISLCLTRFARRMPDCYPSFNMQTLLSTGNLIPGYLWRHWNIEKIFFNARFTPSPSEGS